jgi:pyoverdine/dityrosine biosynthesis protein Dit1
VQHRLDRGEHVFLRDEAHLEIELVEFARRPIGAGILVAEAGRDLEIAIEARHHQQLLEHLRCLRERVELTRVDAARHQEVARALGARRGQDRRLEFGEALADHARRIEAITLERSTIFLWMRSRRRSRKR